VFPAERSHHANAQPAFNSAKYYGYVSVEGVTPPIGTIVRAKIRDKVCGQSEVQNIPDFGIGYNVDVLSAVAEPRCAGYGDTIKFEWIEAAGQPVVACSPTATWDPVGFHRHDLTCSGAAPPEPVTKVNLWQGWNFVEWLLSDCTSAQDAFSGLDGLSVAWKYFANVQGWQSHDPQAAPSLNTLGAVCAADILILHVDSDIVWEQKD
jgi:hypothetical protein